MKTKEEMVKMIEQARSRIAEDRESIGKSDDSYDLCVYWYDRGLKDALTLLSGDTPNCYDWWSKERTVKISDEESKYL